MHGGDRPAVAGDPDEPREPLRARLDERLQRAARPHRLVPVVRMPERVELDQVDVVDAQALERAVEVLARARGVAAARLRGEEEVVAVPRHPRRDAQLRVAVARGGVDVVDAVAEQHLQRAVGLVLARAGERGARRTASRCSCARCVRTAVARPSASSRPPVYTRVQWSGSKLGKTDIDASVLGFGGSEIGYQRVSARTVAKLLGSALDAGLNVIDTAECYEDSEVLIGKAIGTRRREFCALHEVRPRGRVGARGLAARRAPQEHRAQPQAAPDRPRRPRAAPQLLAGRAQARRRHHRARAGARARAGRATSATAATARRRATRSRAGASTRCRRRSASPTRRRSS